MSAVLLLVSGCEEESRKGQPTTDESLKISEQPEDKSLSIAEYREAGLPAPDAPWTAHDMDKAVSALTAIAQKDPSQLPRYQSPRSGEVFARLAADENLTIYRDRSLAIEERLPDALTYLQAGNEVFALFLGAFDKDSVGDNEVVDLADAQFRATVVITALVKELLPALDKNDPTYVERLKGLKTMKSGLATMVEGVLEMLVDSDLGPSARTRMLGQLQQTLPSIIPELRAADQLETLRLLRALLKDPDMQNLKPQMQELLRRVEKALGSPGNS